MTNAEMVKTVINASMELINDTNMWDWVTGDVNNTDLVFTLGYIQGVCELRDKIKKEMES